MPEINPLLRRLQVLPPEGYEQDRTYGDTIQRKRRKYRSGAQAFGVEGFNTAYIPMIVFGVIMAVFFSLMIFVMTRRPKN